MSGDYISWAILNTHMLSFFDYPSILSLASTSHDTYYAIRDAGWFRRGRSIWTNMLRKKWNWSQHIGYFREPHILANHNHTIAQSLKNNIFPPQFIRNSHENIIIEFPLLHLQYMMPGGQSDITKLQTKFTFRLDDSETIGKYLKYITNFKFINTGDNPINICEISQLIPAGFHNGNVVPTPRIDVIATMTNISHNKDVQKSISFNPMWSESQPFALSSLSTIT
jgi:hypothetical protein